MLSTTQPPISLNAGEEFKEPENIEIGKEFSLPHLPLACSALFVWDITITPQWQCKQVPSDNFVTGLG